MSTEWLVWLGQLAKIYWDVAFFIAVFLGGIVPGLLSKFLYAQIKKSVRWEKGDVHLRRVPYLPCLMGYIERAFVFLVVMWLPASAGTAIGGLLAIKMVGGWGSIKSGTTRARAYYSVSLICGLISIMTAILVGLLAAPWWTPTQIKLN
jgi:hypothetical protein